jgi:glyceraldehyde 3-phosphate dehydrogenase
MATRIGINGFGRMGRLALRAGWGRPDLQFVHVNEISGGPETAAHLLTFDSVHGRWDRRVEARDGQVAIDGVGVSFSNAATPEDAPWPAHQVDVVLECSGRRERSSLRPRDTSSADRCFLYDELFGTGGQRHSRGHRHQTWCHHYGP